MMPLIAMFSEHAMTTTAQLSANLLRALLLHYEQLLPELEQAGEGASQLAQQVACKIEHIQRAMDALETQHDYPDTGRDDFRVSIPERFG